MGNLDDALAKFAKRHGIERQLEASNVVEKATAEIAKFIEPTEFEVISFKDGTLKIYAKSSTVANDIRMRGTEMTSKLSLAVRPKIRFTYRHNPSLNTDD